jgi:hypothetical protein
MPKIGRSWRRTGVAADLRKAGAFKRKLKRGGG